MKIPALKTTENSCFENRATGDKTDVGNRQLRAAGEDTEWTE